MANQNVVSMKSLLEAGVHFGHQTRRWNPKMAPYIYTERNGIYIIDLQKTVKKLEEAYAFVRQLSENGQTLLFVGTKKQAQEAIKDEAARCGQYYVNARWLGGMMTNFKTMRTRIDRLNQLKTMQADGTFDMLPKKEVIKHQGEIAFPFKRYQIQPVWRADRPQKGRYREFYQCDVDVIGTRSLLCEVELIQIVERVFRTLGINVSLKVNNRKILYGIAETIGHADKMIDITVAIDKLEKIGLEAVKAELTERGIGSDAIEKLQPILELTGDNERKLAVLRDVIGASAVGLEGISEMETIFGYVNRLGVELPIELDFSLARGLNYYTGAIFEVKALDFAIGSICGGGRYDDLTGIFGMPNMSGVGISFGADRIYDVMTGLGLFPADLGCAARVMFANLGEAEEHASLKLLQEVRAAGIPAEIYPENGKMKKQMEYANRRGIPCVVIVGSRELEERVATIKDMTSGEQTQVPFTRLAEALR